MGVDAGSGEDAEDAAEEADMADVHVRAAMLAATPPGPLHTHGMRCALQALHLSHQLRAVWAGLGFLQAGGFRGCHLVMLLAKPKTTSGSGGVPQCRR
jgi:hypothetical protein